ncbi:MAG TPA: pantoate--beta-alanine ligase [Caulobacteraceae bacterium]|jgi:pantoate--beta-alanine ligase
METAELPIVRTPGALKARVTAWREKRERVALVPTMGALHEGHLSLIRMAKAQADRVVCSIFVNPKQFGPNEDLDAYPRQEAADVALLAGERCDLLYAPTGQAMYPPGFATNVRVGGVTEGLDGAARPGHFDGVATVVAKLLIQCGPDVAIFGEKDYQQLLVIRRLARDLDLTTEILAAPTARAEDGLALSSRNAYLADDERRVAGKLNLVLKTAAAAAKAGADAAVVEAAGRAGLEQAGFEAVDYFEVRAAEDLRRFEGKVDAPARVFAAARLGRTRLIDNWPV